LPIARQLAIVPAMFGPPALVGIPYDAGSSYRRGAAAAPDEIRRALRSDASNTWSESGIDVGTPDRLGDIGDLDVSDDARIRETIERGIKDLIAAGHRPLSLGGDHSITYPIIRGFGRLLGQFTLLQIDAHPDLYPAFQDDRFSHACPFARIMEEGLVQRLVQVGIRTMNGEQRDNAERFGVEVIDMRDWAAGARPNIEGPVYVSLDMDGLDPAFAPGVSHREPGGLATRDVISLIQSLPGPIVGADVVEFNPGEDVAGMTAPVCAKLVKELASRMNEVR
jgi:arginase